MENLAGRTDADISFEKIHIKPFNTLVLKNAAIVAFLKNNGVSDAEISIAPPEIIDMEIGQGGRVDVWNVDCFFTFPEQNSIEDGENSIFCSFFRDLFGHDGLVLSYFGQLDRHTWVTFHDYYYFDSNRNPVLLARVHGSEPEILDLDGDGTNELLSDGDGTSGGAQLVFQRDGQLYEANLTDLLQAAWPEMTWWDNSTVDTSRRCLTIVGMVQDAEGGTPYGFTRYLYFDGENILVYQDNTTYTDHVADDIDVPEAVLSAAKDAVLSDLDYWRTHTGAWSYVDGVEQQTGTQAEWDDWRITELELTDTVPAYPELGMRVYSLGYELHTTTPENVMLAGGMYMDEGGWVGGLNTLPPVLVFHTMANSGPVLLQSSIPNDVGRTSDNPMFAGCIAQVALENGLLTPSEVRPVDLYYMFYNGQDVFLNLIGAFPVEEQNAALDAMAEYAVSVADTDDGGLLADGLQRLEEYDTLYELTEEGEAAHRRLLEIVNGGTAPAPPTEAELQAAILNHQGSILPMASDYCAEAHQVLQETSGQDTHTFHLYVYFSSYLQEDDAWVQDWYSLFPASVTFRCENGVWQPVEYWGFYGSDSYDRVDLFPDFPEDVMNALWSGGEPTEQFDELAAALRAECLAAADAYFAQHPGSS